MNVSTRSTLRPLAVVVRSGACITKRLQPTGRGAAPFTPELDEPRPAAEAHVVRQLSTSRALPLLSLCLMLAVGACVSESVPSVGFVSGAPKVPTGITAIRLVRSNVGEQRSHWEYEVVEITPSATTAERATAYQARTRIDGRTSPDEWARLCELVGESGLFGAQGATVLAFGAHAGSAEVTVTFADGTSSTVEHHAFHSAKRSPFWDIVRIIEGSSLNALPHSTQPELP